MEFSTDILRQYTLPQVFTRGVNLSDEVTIDYFNFNETHNTYEFQVIANIHGTSFYTIDIDFAITKNDNMICNVVGDCDCPYDDYSHCKHQIATIAHLIEQGYIDRAINQMNTGQKVTYTSNRIANAMQDIFQMSLAKQVDPLYELIPQLEIEGQRTYLKLKIGILGGKSFVIKNIFDFVSLMNNRADATYGSNTEVMHDIELFDNKDFTNYVVELLDTGSSVLETTSAQGSSGWYGYSRATLKYEKKRLLLSSEKLVEVIKLAGPTIQLKIGDDRMSKFDILKRQTKFGFELKYEEDFVTFTPEHNYRFLSVSDNTLAYIKSDEKIINIIDMNNDFQPKLLSNLLLNENNITHDDLYTFEYSYLNRINEYVKNDFDFSDIYGELKFADIVTQLDLQDKQLSVRTFVEDNQKNEYVFNVEKYQNLMMLQTQIPCMPLTSGVENEFFYVIDGLKDIIDFSSKFLNVVDDNSDRVEANEAFSNFKVKQSVKIAANVSAKRNQSILKFSSSEYSDEELRKVLKAIGKNEEYVEVREGEYIDLNSESIQEIKDVCERVELDLSKNDELEHKYPKASAYYLSTVVDNAKGITSSSDDVIEALLEDYNTIANQKERKVPVDATLRDYQHRGLNWLHYLQKYSFGGILADDMGLGKTLQVISLLQTSKLKKPSIIITPAALVYNWQREFEKFVGPDTCTVIDGTASERSKIINNISSNNIYVTSYDLVKRDIEDYEMEFDYIILDEAQAIKNPNSKAAKSVKSLVSNYKLALTGTPIENNLLELWSIFDFAMPGFLGNQSSFKKQFINPISKGSEVAEAELQGKITPFILRRLKKDVLTELPDKTEKVIYVQMEKEQRKLYDAKAMDIKNFLDKSDESEFKKKQIEILAEITKLRQIACNPTLLDENFKGNVAKEQFLEESLLNLIEGGHKIIIFSQFVSNFDHIISKLDELNIESYKITGQTPKGMRHSLVEKFNNNNVPVFLISLKAGGTGLNITGADTVIHYDPWWNTAVESQATDRVHRMGQKNNVLVYKLICENTIEEQIIKLQAEKAKLVESLIDGNSSANTKLSREDFINLFDN